MKSRRWLLGVAGMTGALSLGRPKCVLAQAYAYDASGRLTQVTHSDGRVTTYTYDNAGNRTQRTTAVPPPPPPPPPPLSVTLSDVAWGSDPTYSDPPITATAAGGLPPYSYQWQRVSGDVGFAATSATSASTAWRPRAVDAAKPQSAQWRCQVTDSNGTIAYSAQVFVSYSPF